MKQRLSLYEAFPSRPSSVASLDLLVFNLSGFFSRAESSFDISSFLYSGSPYYPHFLILVPPPFTFLDLTLNLKTQAPQHPRERSASLGQRTVPLWDMNSPPRHPWTRVTFHSSPFAREGSRRRAGCGGSVASGTSLWLAFKIISGSYTGCWRSKVFRLLGVKIALASRACVFSSGVGRHEVAAFSPRKSQQMTLSGNEVVLR